MKRICVYCGSNLGTRNSYLEAARSLGTEMAAKGITLVYGGNNIGLMGVIADTMLELDGEVIGVIPQFLMDKEVVHTGLSDLKIVNSMHERKSLMVELSDAFIALPGGFGTLDEFCEVITWAQIGIHHKACGLLNIDGYYSGLLSFLDRAVADKFISPENRKIVLLEKEPQKLLKKLSEFDLK